MAVNASRNMNAELEQGLRDGSYMQLHPGWGGESMRNPAIERMSWPTYKHQVERHQDVVDNRPISPRESAPAGGMYVVGRHDSALPDNTRPGWEGSGPDSAADAYNPSIPEDSALDERADAAAIRAGGGSAGISAHERVVSKYR